MRTVTTGCANAVATLVAGAGTQTTKAQRGGAIALWVREFGPAVGTSSVRDLQVLFCGER
jgi:hypothetical protein